MDDQEVVRLWQEAVELIDKDDLTAAYERLEVIDDPPNAIVFNAAVLQMIGEYYEDAFENFTESLGRDPHLVVGFYLRGMTSYYNQEFGQARDDFEQAKKEMRGAKFINYGPLGMNLALCEFQVLANLAMLNLVLDLDIERSRSIMAEAVASKEALSKDSSAKEVVAKAMETPLPEFNDDLIDRCRDTDCPLIDLKPVPVFRPRGVAAGLLKENTNDYLALNKSKVLYASSHFEDHTGFGGKYCLENLRPLYKRFGRNRLKRKPKTIEKLIRCCSPIAMDIIKPHIISSGSQSPSCSQPSTPDGNNKSFDFPVSASDSSRPSTPVLGRSASRQGSLSRQDSRPGTPTLQRSNSARSSVVRQQSRPGTPLLHRRSMTASEEDLSRPSSPSGRTANRPRPLSIIRPFSPTNGNQSDPSSPLPLSSPRARAGSMPSLAARSVDRPQSPAFRDAGSRPQSPLVRGDTIDGRRGSRPGTPTAFSFDSPMESRMSIAQRHLSRQGRCSSIDSLDSPSLSRSNSLSRESSGKRGPGHRGSLVLGAQSTEDLTENRIDLLFKGKSKMTMVRPHSMTSSFDDITNADDSVDGDDMTLQEVLTKMASLGNGFQIHLHFDQQAGEEIKNGLNSSVQQQWV